MSRAGLAGTLSQRCGRCRRSAVVLGTAASEATLSEACPQPTSDADQGVLASAGRFYGLAASRRDDPERRVEVVGTSQDAPTRSSNVDVSRKPWLRIETVTRTL